MSKENLKDTSIKFNDEKSVSEWKDKPIASNLKASPRWDSRRPVNIGHSAPDQTPAVESIKIGEITFNISYSRCVPSLSQDEFDVLCGDIAARGILVPVIIDENNHIIDGEHRLMAAQKLGLKQIPFQVRPGLTEEEKHKLAQDLNLHRRHLSPEKIKEIYEINRKFLPEMALKLRQEGKSYRQIGQEMDISHQQVKNMVDKQATVNDLTVELPQVIKGKDGRVRPAKSPVIQAHTLKEVERAITACQTAGAENLPNKSIELKRVEKIAKEFTRQKLRQEEIYDFKTGQVELLQGDFREKGQDIQDNSIDLIFTDPPYDQAWLPQWEDLGVLAQRVLKPGGLLMSYSGNLYLPQIFEMLGKNLTYLWLAAVRHTGATKLVPAVKVHQAWKPVLVFYKPPLDKWWKPSLDMVSGGESKEHHDWEQSVAEAAYYIKTFCPQDGVLLDPMMGSGTSIIAGMQSGLGLKCIGMELDKATYIEAQRRIQGSQQINNP